MPASDGKLTHLELWSRSGPLIAIACGVHTQLAMMYEVCLIDGLTAAFGWRLLCIVSNCVKFGTGLGGIGRDGVREEGRVGGWVGGSERGWVGGRVGGRDGGRYIPCR